MSKNKKSFSKRFKEWFSDLMSSFWSKTIDDKMTEAVQSSDVEVNEAFEKNLYESFSNFTNSSSKALLLYITFALGWLLVKYDAGVETVKVLVYEIESKPTALFILLLGATFFYYRYFSTLYAADRMYDLLRKIWEDKYPNYYRNSLTDYLIPSNHPLLLEMNTYEAGANVASLWKFLGIGFNGVAVWLFPTFVLFYILFVSTKDSINNNQPEEYLVLTIIGVLLSIIAILKAQVMILKTWSFKIIVGITIGTAVVIMAIVAFVFCWLG